MKEVADGRLGEEEDGGKFLQVERRRRE